MALNNLISITFTSQPNAGDTIVFDYSVGITLGNATGIYNTDITIGATLTDTIQNTLDYFVAEFGANINPSNITSYIVGNIGYIKIEGIDVDFLSFEDEPARFTISITEFASLTKINIRTPYFIEINESGQEGSRIEVFIWNKGNTIPTIPQHILSKPIVSSLQTANQYNISNYAKEYINPINPVNVSVPTEENTNTWCYMRISRYKLVSSEYILIDTKDYVCLNGFNSYQDGYNKELTDTEIALANSNIKRYQVEGVVNYVNMWLENGTYVYDNEDDSLEFIVTNPSVYKIPIKGETNVVISSRSYKFFGLSFCEPIYTPVKCSFVNRYGGWDFITLFKAKINSFEGKSSDYNLLQPSIDYNPLIGKNARFNQSLMQKVKCNTGFVPENYSELIQDLIVSDVVLLDNKPVKLLTTSFEEKTSLKDNNINYELEFEYNYNLINDVI